MIETNVPKTSKGERRREEILRATLRIIGRSGTATVTHRAVAEEAGVPLSATTYYFDSKVELLAQALVLAAREDTERLERLVLELAPRELGPEHWAEAVAATLADDVRADPGKHVALYELGLESTRTPALRPEMERWELAHLRLAEVGARAVGSREPQRDALVIVATITGLLLPLLADPEGDYESAVLRPALERLFESLAGDRQTVSL